MKHQIKDIQDFRRSMGWVTDHMLSGKSYKTQFYFSLVEPVTDLTSEIRLMVFSRIPARILHDPVIKVTLKVNHLTGGLILEFCDDDVERELSSSSSTDDDHFGPVVDLERVLPRRESVLPLEIRNAPLSTEERDHVDFYIQHLGFNGARDYWIGNLRAGRHLWKTCPPLCPSRDLGRIERQTLYLLTLAPVV